MGREWIPGSFLNLKTFIMYQELFDKQKLIIDRINEIKKRALPHGYTVDLDALENISGGSGEKFTPQQALDYFFSKGILISRGNPGIQEIDSPTQFQLAGLYNELIDICEEMQKQHTIITEQNNQ